MLIRELIKFGAGNKINENNQQFEQRNKETMNSFVSPADFMRNDS